MFKKMLFCLLIPGFISLHADIKKTYRFETPQVINNAVRLNECRTSRQGFEPMVAVKPVLLALPIGHEAVSFDVAFSGRTLLDGEHYLKPYVPNVAADKRPHPELHKIKSPVYDTNEFFPRKVRSNWFTTQYKNGIPVFVTSLNPVQYNAVSGKIQYYRNISITVRTQPAKRAPAAVVCTPATKSLIQILVDNKEAVATLEVTQKDGDDYEYLIITPETLKDYWGEFITFNENRCLRTKIETIQNVLSTSTGTDPADKLRNFIIKEYTDHKIVYVLLGGDVTSTANSIPHREFRAQMYDCTVEPEKFKDEKDIKADMYFACLDGDWKTDSGGTVHDYYGEPGTIDMFWEVYAGRFPVDNKTDLDNLVNKTIMYSENPVKGQVMNNFLAGNFMWDDFGVEVFGGDYVEQFMGVSTANDYTTHGFPTDRWNTQRLYEKNGTWQIAQFRSMVNSHKPTWIDHMGHGNHTYSFNETNSGVTNTNYKNDGTNANFFVILTSACYPGDFTHNDCLLEQFVKLENGAVACIGCSKSSWGSDYGTDGSTQRPFRYLHDACFNPAKRVPFLEPMHAIGKEEQAEIVLNTTITTPPYYGSITYCIYETNLLGDPALSRWTEEPKEWTDLPECSATPAEFTMKTPPYTWVALLDESGKIITTQLTGYVYGADESFLVQDSACKINDDLYKNYVASNPGKKLGVRIKAHNYMPYESEVGVTTDILANTVDLLPIRYNVISCGKNIRITYSLLYKDLISISVYNSKGSLVKMLFSGVRNAGEYTINYNSNSFNSGVYYVRFNTGNFQGIKKVAAVK